MDDIILSFIAKIAEYAVGPILHHAQYLCCFNNFTQNLPNAKEELELTRDSVKERVKEAKNKTEEIEPIVEKWLKDVDKVLEEVQQLEEKISKISKSCFKRRCQYFLAKEIARKIEKMTQLNRNSKFERLSRITELPGMEFYPPKGFILFESTKLTYNKLLEALKDKSVSMVGLVGLGGSGKTALAKAVGKKAEELKLFDKVVMATISQTPNIRSIQAQIADKLGVPLTEESEEGRAQRLYKRLSEGTSLLILDDVWEKLDFEALGIPFNENKNCRVLLTSRSRQVCTSMQCERIIDLNLLTEEEGWTLFKSCAKLIDDCVDSLEDVARKIVHKCEGWPIAIVTVGSTLRDKSFEDWKYALSRLEDSRPLDIPKGFRCPYVCLQLSYDNLTNQLAKTLFLLCSTFPEDYEIDLEDLFRCGKGLGPIESSETMEKARMEIQMAIKILMDSCLLLQANDEEKVKMHDMVRDVALWIASQRDQAILVSTGVDPTTLAENESIKGKKAISLWNVKDGQLPINQLNCPTLEILLICPSADHFVMLDGGFEKMKMLKILVIISPFFRYFGYRRWIDLSLPQSIKSLKNLHTLCLRGYKLGNISILDSLQTLEILDLRGSSFEELPNGIVGLKKLKLLDLYNCCIAKHNAYQVIEKCLHLEELYLHLYPSEEDFPLHVSFSRLRRYVILQHPSKLYNYKSEDILKKYKPSRALCIEGFNVSPQRFISLPIMDLFQRAEYLHLKDLSGGYKNIIPCMDLQGMNQLIVLILESCSEIECLFDNADVYMLQIKGVFSSLVTLSLNGLDSLREVFHDPSSRCCLKNLEELKIKACGQLRSLSFLRSSKLCNLKEMTIKRCPMLTSLLMSSIIQNLQLLEALYISRCNELKHIIDERDIDFGNNQYHSSFTLPKLRILHIKRCDKLKYIFSVSFAQGLISLEQLSIKDCCELKYVFENKKEDHVSVNQHQQSQHHNNIDINFLNLDYLALWSLPNLVDILPQYCHPHFPNLKSLVWVGCPTLFGPKVVNDSNLQQDTGLMEKEILWVVATTFNQLPSMELKVDPKRIPCLQLGDVVGVKGIYEFQIGEANTNTQIVPFNFNLELSRLGLWNLPELQFIWKGPTNFLNLQMLHSIYVGECPKLRSIFSPTIVTSLPMLFNLEIYKCEELEEIFDSQQLKTLYTCSQHVCFPQLNYITITYCNKLKYLFHNFVAAHFPNLEWLEIRECCEIEKGFDFECEADDDDGDQQGTGKDGQQLPLQNLTDIRLTSLPKFKEIHSGFKLKDNVEQSIEDCPKYSSNLYLYPDT